MIDLGDRLLVIRDREQIAAHLESERMAAQQAATRAHAARQRAMRRHRMVAWSDQRLILAMYRLAAQMTRETGVPHEVDHVVPLLGRTVSGLHVETNLRVVTRAANRLKSNHFAEDGGGR